MGFAFHPGEPPFVFRQLSATMFRTLPEGSSSLSREDNCFPLLSLLIPVSAGLDHSQMCRLFFQHSSRYLERSISRVCCTRKVTLHFIPSDRLFRPTDALTRSFIARIVL